jgi:hypothetical protein
VPAARLGGNLSIKYANIILAALIRAACWEPVGEKQITVFCPFAFALLRE